MSVEIDEDPKVVMVIPPEVLTTYRKVGVYLRTFYGNILTQSVITNYESYLYYRDVRKNLIMEKKKTIERIFEGY